MLLPIWGLAIQAFPQRYNFQQFDIDKGLAQSQVTAFAQDNHRRLWIATLGGISCFNGRQFNSYARTSGLNSNFTLSLAVNAKNELLIGSARGITKYDGQHFSNYPDSDNSWTKTLVAGSAGAVFAIQYKRLYQILDHGKQRISVSKDTAEMVTALHVDQKGKIWAAVYQKGLYTLENNRWTLRYAINESPQNLVINDMLIDQADPASLWLLTTDGIHLLNQNKIKKVFPEINGQCMSIAQDKNGAICVGTNQGAYFISSSQMIHFNGNNGFTNNVVNKIFKDVENNIWLGTDGAGIFKFTNNNYITFDETQGLGNRIVMSISRGPNSGTLWLGSYGGIYEYKKGLKIKNIRLPTNNNSPQHINFLYTDRKGNVWVGTPRDGLWKHDGKAFARINKPSDRIAYNAIIEDSAGTIWLSTDNGCLIYSPATRGFQKLTSQFGGGLLELGKDSVIVGTQNGPLLVVNKKNISRLNIKALAGSSILSMYKHNDQVLFGTADYGLIIWNSKTGKTGILNTKSGLNSDHIYSILNDKNGTIWLGTGRGIARLTTKGYRIITNGTDDNLLVECNQNAILKYDNKIWIGTTKGAIAYVADPASETRVKPFIYINSANIFFNYKRKHKQDTVKTLYKGSDLNKIPDLPYDHNHINISYTGIFLTNPEKIAYKYRLVGLDNKFNNVGTNTSVNFTALAAGKYKFEVIAVTKEGVSSSNVASFTFQIQPPYYQTGLFRFVAITCIVLLILSAVYTILKLNERKRKLRLKIKLEEQFKIRKQTAEDFHDDLGNKLTRITVLSEVLSSMIDVKDTEKREILYKINNNVNELYTGTKDILWSLNPKNDTLGQLLGHIINFGEEMFNDTPIKFSHRLQLSNRDSRLSLDISRNILLIFKESIHNILKHSRASEAVFDAALKDDVLTLSIHDNGHGFDLEHDKNGHGVNNLHLRSKRINSRLNINTGPGGTSISLTINFSTLTHFKNV